MKAMLLIIVLDPQTFGVCLLVCLVFFCLFGFSFGQSCRFLSSVLIILMVLVIFLDAVTKHLTKSNLRNEGFILAHNFRT